MQRSRLLSLIAAALSGERVRIDQPIGSIGPFLPTPAVSRHRTRTAPDYIRARRKAKRKAKIAAASRRRNRK